VWAHGTNLCEMYNYHDSRAHGHERSGILSRLDGLEYGMVWFVMIFGVACV
jgi:hypothetical protein